MPELFDILKDRKVAPKPESYTAKLFADRNMLLKKIMEEAFEVATYRDRANLRWEIADLVYFISVLAADEGIDWKEIESERASRRR
jgi:phosphoribosyl-ATP pyrophosphohydrolase